MKTLIYILCFTLLSGAAFAAGRGMASYEYPWVMRSVEALGMGNAFYTKSDNKYAPFYNPAGLARINRGRIDIIPLSVGINTNIDDLYSDYRDIDSDNSSQVAELLRDHMGKYQHAELSLYPAYSRQNFVVGIFGATQVNAMPANPVLPELDLDLTADAGFVIGLAHSFFEGKLNTGAAIRYQKRYSYLRSYTFNEIAADELSELDTDLLKQGDGFFADFGFIYNFYTDGANPRIGVAVNNLGTNAFGRAKDLPWSVNLSFGISPLYKAIKTDFIIDLIDITQNFEQDYDFVKRLNLGAQIKFFNRFALRTGLHQGYVTAGAGIDLKYLELNYAYYREEIGAYAGQKDDERHALELVLRL